MDHADLVTVAVREIEDGDVEDVVEEQNDKSVSGMLKRLWKTTPKCEKGLKNHYSQSLDRG